MKITLVAPSSVVGKKEFEKGLEILKSCDFDIKVHPQSYFPKSKSARGFYAGTDTERANAFFEAAQDPECDAVWCARGGYGANKTIPILDRLTEKHGIPRRKLLIGYSDATLLHEYVRQRWNWKTLHSPMPGHREFSGISKPQLELLGALIQDSSRKFQLFEKNISKRKLKVVSNFGEKNQVIEGAMIGGNLSLLATGCGTPYQIKCEGKILFLEDVMENLSRVDRMVAQITQSGCLEGVKAIILGTFSDCKDVVPLGMPKKGTVNKKNPLIPLRKALTPDLAFREIFSSIAECYRIPVYSGLPVGHGGGLWSLPLGAVYRIDPQGFLQLKRWD